MGEVDTKVYVGGLATETTKEDLQAQFSKYGDIVDCVVMMDKATNRSRGFGFVTYKDAAAVNAALGTTITMDGRDLTCKKAVRDTPKQIVQDSSGGTYNTVKLFVGGLPSSCDYTKLTEYFGRFGEIQDAVVMMDQQTQRHRGFGYVTFTDGAAVEEAIKLYPDNKIDGKWVEVKRCIPQDAMKGGGGGGGGGRRPGSQGPDGDNRGGEGYSAYPGVPDYGVNPYADPYAAYYAAAGYPGYNPYGAYMGYPGMPQAGYPGMPPGYPGMPPGYPAGYPGMPPGYGYPGYPAGYPGMPSAGPALTDGTTGETPSGGDGRARSRSGGDDRDRGRKRSRSRRRRRRRDRSMSSPP